MSTGRWSCEKRQRSGNELGREQLQLGFGLLTLFDMFAVGSVARVALDIGLGAAVGCRARSSLLDRRRGGTVLEGPHEEVDDGEKEVEDEGSHLGRSGSVYRVHGLVQLGVWEGSEGLAVNC
jgi:hypothetical protein